MCLLLVDDEEKAEGEKRDEEGKEERIESHESEFSSVQFSSAQSFDRLGRRGNMMDDSAAILFQSFLQEALVSGSGMDRDVHSLMLFTQHFLS